MLAPFSLVLTRIAILLGFHKPKPLFTKTEEQEIVAAIAAAEETTSAEIRVHISTKSKNSDVLVEAKATFDRLGMHKTEERNGILLFLVPANKQFAILGDEGINSKVIPEAWDQIRDRMQSHFKQQQFKEGVLFGIHQAGALLSDHFQPRLTNPNELSNEISTDA